MNTSTVVAKRPQSIVLGICTYERPEMLLRCLSSVSRLVAPRDTRLTIIVVDNEKTAPAREIVQSFHSDIEIYYFPEPRRGIATARNAVLDAARELGADWIVMLDDDQRVAPDWICRLWSAKQGSDYLDERRQILQADVIQSAVELQIPDIYPRLLPWAFPKKVRTDWKFDRHHAATNGVMFRANLPGFDGEPIRFDERYNLTGGEDRDFFRRAYLCGARIVWTPEAIAFETVPASKLTYSAQVGRAYWIAAVNVEQDAELFGMPRTMAMYSISFTASLFSGLAAVLMSPFLALHNERSGRAKFLKGSKKIVKAAGIAVGLTRGVHLEPYRTIHGS